MYFKCDYVKVTGFKEAMEVMYRKYPSAFPSDSYITHIEDADTLETAPYQFVLGEGDKKVLTKNCEIRREFLNMIIVYSHIITDNAHILRQSDVTHYSNLVWVYNELLAGNSQFDSDDLHAWLWSLPYFDIVQEEADYCRH